MSASPRQRTLHALASLALLATFLTLASCSGKGSSSGEPMDNASASGADDATKRAATKGEGAKKADAPKLVRVSELEPQAIEERLPCTSHIEALHSVDILAQVRGQLRSVTVREGQSVTAGSRLFELDKREPELQLQAAKNRVQNAQNQARDAELSIAEAKDRIAQAEIDFQQAKRSLDRRKESAAQNLASDAQLEDAQLAFDKAKNAVDLANNTLRVAEHGLLKAKTEVASAEIQVKIQERILEDSTILAPIDGVIPELIARGGEWIVPQGKLCTIVANDQLVLNLKRPQKELGRLAVGQRVDVQVDAWPELTFAGTIDYISPIVDPQTGTFRARVRLENDAERRLRPGMFCRAWIVTGTNPEALLIPKEAIVYEAEQPYAFVVRDGKAERITIDRGIDLKDAVEAKNVAAQPTPGSFAKGDRVVVVGVDGLATGGVPVQVVKS
ncbi:MAG: efflux RND transporter periplasmic adaptor subunit [Planctomycetes bacterium]|nr:efflux RND transporter periplasmic adaptor subunit [Planctomycetota bacterium]